jgi:hypothetical protein
MQRSMMFAGALLALVSLSAQASSFPSPPLYASFNTPRATVAVVKFSVANSIYTQPAAINGKGAIAGSYRDAHSVYRGFLR